MSLMELAAIGAFAALLADAAICDMRGLRIPNRDPAIAALLFLVTYSFILQPQIFLLHLLAGASMFAAGAILFSFRLWGGGDAKLLAAAALWTGFAGMPRFLVVMALTGGIMAVLVMSLKSLAETMASPGSSWRARLERTSDLPYGVAIAVAGMDWAAIMIKRGFVL